MTTERPEPAERVRELLATRPDRREVRMFGGLSFMVDGQMVVTVRRNGDLLVRVDPARSAELLTRPGARQAEMGPGRTMGPSWISVAAEAVTADEPLAFWVGVALDRHDRAHAG